MKDLRGLVSAPVIDNDDLVGRNEGRDRFRRTPHGLLDTALFVERRQNDRKSGSGWAHPGKILAESESRSPQDAAPLDRTNGVGTIVSPISCWCSREYDVGILKPVASCAKTRPF